MEEKKIYTEAEIEELAEKASQNAMAHFKNGLNCGECAVSYTHLFAANIAGQTAYPHRMFAGGGKIHPQLIKSFPIVFQKIHFFRSQGHIQRQ